MLTLFSACFARVSKASATLMLFLALTSKYGMSFSLHQAEAVSSGTCGEGGEDGATAQGWDRGPSSPTRAQLGEGRVLAVPEVVVPAALVGTASVPKGSRGMLLIPSKSPGGGGSSLPGALTFM